MEEFITDCYLEFYDFLAYVKIFPFNYLMTIKTSFVQLNTLSIGTFTIPVITSSILIHSMTPH